MRSELWVCAILACAAASPPAAPVKLGGKVLDATALKNVKTYCVDTSNLKGLLYTFDYSDPEAFDVSEVIKRESGPKGLLSKLPWKLEADCSAPGVDAILRFDFSFLRYSRLVQPIEGVHSRGPEPYPEHWRVLLQVADKASSRVIYKAEAKALDYRLERAAAEDDDYEPQAGHVERQKTAYNALRALTSDVKAISQDRKNSTR